MTGSEISKADKVVGVVFAVMGSIALAGLACYAIFAIVVHFPIFNGLIWWTLRSVARLLAVTGGIFLAIFAVLIGSYLRLIRQGS